MNAVQAFGVTIEIRTILVPLDFSDNARAVLEWAAHLAKEHASKMKPPSIKGYYYQILSLVGWSSLPWLHKLRVPTLVMAGDDDPIIPLINARLMAARLPHGRLRVVDCGHLFLLTRAGTLAPEIEAFFAS